MNLGWITDSESDRSQVLQVVVGHLAADAGARTVGEAEVEGAHALPRVWIAVRKNVRSVFEHVTLADIASGELPLAVQRLADDPDAWVTR